MHIYEKISGLCVFVLLLLVSPATQAESICDPDGLQASGSIYRICLPPAAQYNGDLMIWAHGFQDAGTPVSIPEDQLNLGGIQLNEIVNLLGFGFATNSYSKTGLAVQQGMDDILDLVNIYTAQYGAPQRVFLTGASEGGLITTLLIEQNPTLFNGGVAACGPIGSFPYQINYFGDARVTFEVFFPGLIPGDMFDPPQAIVEDWANYYETVVKPVVFDPVNQDKLNQWVSVAKLPFDAADYLNTVAISVQDVLRYSVVNSADATATLGGFPYNNSNRVYTGTANDNLFNLLVQRFTADPAAIQEMQNNYSTSGQLDIPLVTMHTTRDQQVPYLHQQIYTLRTLASGDLGSNHIPIKVDRYEHCNFNLQEVIISLFLMLNLGGGL
jgi:pimeloyl-ACP methyl ester carboxylesterase